MDEVTSASTETRLESFQRLDADRTAFLKNILAENAELRANLQSTKSDYDDQLESRRNWQAKAKDAEDKLREVAETSNDNPFAVVLIDGDGYIFRDELLHEGAIGGAKAAQQLFDEIHDYFRKFDGSKGWKLVVRIYVNLEGLKQTYISRGLYAEEVTLREFATGFTQNQPLFDFVDVGYGKERADHKIKELFGLFVKDTHCKQLILGCCHDNGYVVILDPYKHSTGPASRITLLQGPRPGREYSKLPFETLKLHNLFRETPLPDNGTQQVRSDPFYTTVPWRPARGHEFAGNGFFEKPTTFDHPMYPRSICLNEENERVDDAFPEPDADDWAKFYRRIKQQKICNDYTLRGRCANKQCPFAHMPDLPLGEVYVLAKRARLTACHHGSACRSHGCVNGHVCPDDEDCTRGIKCKFARVHGKDTNAATEIRLPEDTSTDH